MSHVFIGLFLALVIFGAHPGFAVEETETAPSAAPAVQEAPPAPAKTTVKPKQKEDPEKTAERNAKIHKLAEEKRQDLNGSQWEVTVSSPDPKAKAVGKDVLTFQNNQVVSRNLSKRGFTPTNYTITPLDEGERAMWESMQTGSEGVVFIKGDWKEGEMSGSMTEQFDGGKVSISYYFTSAARKKVAENSEEREAETKPTAAEAKAPAKALTSTESAKTGTSTKAKTKKKSTN